MENGLIHIVGIVIMLCAYCDASRIMTLNYRYDDVTDQWCIVYERVDINSADARIKTLD
jgi:hypothetical protein